MVPIYRPRSWRLTGHLGYKNHTCMQCVRHTHTHTHTRREVGLPLIRLWRGLILKLPDKARFTTKGFITLLPSLPPIPISHSLSPFILLFSVSSWIHQCPLPAHHVLTVFQTSLLLHPSIHPLVVSCFSYPFSPNYQPRLNLGNLDPTKWLIIDLSANTDFLWEQVISFHHTPM